MLIEQFIGTKNTTTNDLFIGLLSRLCVRPGQAQPTITIYFLYDSKLWTNTPRYLSVFVDASAIFPKR